MSGYALEVERKASGVLIADSALAESLAESLAGDSG
jgi:hypothetical protein